MKFTIERASDLGYDNRPCENAIKEILTQYDRRNFKSFEEMKERLNENFLDEGFDHKVTEDGIQRSFKKPYWTIEFNSLDELMDFVNKEGRIVIETSYWTDYDNIIIYDDYLE